jgi:hypothetical protein
MLGLGNCGLEYRAISAYIVVGTVRKNSRTFNRTKLSVNQEEIIKPMQYTVERIAR